MKGKRNGEEKSLAVRKKIEAKGYTLLNEYINEKTKLSLICQNGHERNCTYSTFRSYGCKTCTNEIKLRDLISKIEILGFSFTIYPENAKGIAEAKCSNGHIRKTKIHNFINFGCGICSGNEIKNIEYAKEIFSKSGFELLETTYVNCKTKMRYICTCGEERRITLDALSSHGMTSCNKCKGKKVSGELAPTWKGGITPKEKLLRTKSDYNIWRKSVFTRDAYTCQKCHVKGEKLRGHHILNWSSNKEMRYSIDNGITLCSKCHDLGEKNSFHSIYGTKNNTREQVEEFIGRKLQIPINANTNVVNDCFFNSKFC